MNPTESNLPGSSPAEILPGLRTSRLAIPAALAALAAAAGLQAQTRLTAGPIQFDMIEVENKFVSEGVGVGDVDKDGDMDLFVGDYWYEAPGKSYAGTWVKREIRPANAGGNQNVKGYSKCHDAFVGDFNNDGYPDPLIVPFHGEQPTWYENPKVKTNTRWKAHSLGYNYGVEQSWYADIDGSGKKSLLTSNLADKSWSYWTPDAEGKFTETKITSANAPKTGIFEHGLGMADVNGDSRPDLIHQQGWYENPGSKALWRYHPDKFSDQPLTEPSHLWTYDFDKDGRLDIFTASSHNPGIWWFNQTAPGVWKHNTINSRLNTNHAIVMKDMDLDGVPDFVSGKRMWAHDVPADGVDVGIYWIKVTPGPQPKFELHMIKDQNAGVGTQFEVQDINGDLHPDIIVSNKAGTKIYLQVPRASSVTPSLHALRAPARRPALRFTGRGVVGLPVYGAAHGNARGAAGSLISVDGRLIPAAPSPLMP